MDETTTQAETLDAKLPVSDGLEDPSTPTEVSAQDANAGKSMQDFVRESMAKAKTGESQDAESDVVESEGEEKSSSKVEQDIAEGEETAEKGKETEKPEGEKEAPEGEEKEVEEGEAVPYERFREVNERAKNAETSLRSANEEVKAYRSITDHCQRNNITPEQFVKAMDTLAAINNGDIEKVAPQIQAWYDQVQSVTGNKLPPDIQEKVDNGLDLEVARQWAKDRARAQLVEGKGRRTVEQLRADQEKEMRRQNDLAAGQWIADKMKSDPDFRKGTLKFDEVEDRYQNLCNQVDERGNFINPVRNPSDMVALMNRAYNDINERNKKRANGRPLTRKVLPTGQSSNGSTKTRFEDAKTMGEAIKIGMKERGHNFI